MILKMTLLHISGKRTVSRLHMDATDNLYVLLCGRKTFKLLSPHYAPLLKTIAPTYAVTSNGLSFQFNPANNNTSVDAASARNYHFSMATDSELEVHKNPYLLAIAVVYVVFWILIGII